MIKEFALAPEALAQSHRECSYFLEKFGVDQGRVISKFPSRWKRLVYDAALQIHQGKLELSRIELCLQNLAAGSLFSSGRPGGDEGEPWLSRAIAENERDPFAAIIATAIDAGCPSILLAADLDDGNEAFRAQGQSHIPRTAEAIIECVGLLIRTARTIKLVDPHIKANLPRWGHVLQYLLKQVRPGTTIEIHRTDDALPGNIRGWFDSAIPPMLREGVRLKVFLHKKEGMHNRFILTEAGGASYHTGLDEHAGGDADGTQEDLVTLLREDVRRVEWNRYPSDVKAFLEYPARVEAVGALTVRSGRS